MLQKRNIKNTVQLALVLLLTTTAFAQTSTNKLKNKHTMEHKIVNKKADTVYFHNLIFWLKPDLKKEQIVEFKHFFEGLSALPYQKNLRYGIPAASTPRAVLDQTYTYSASMEFSSLEDLEAYGKLDKHLELVAKYKPFITKMLVYDTVYTK